MLNRAVWVSAFLLGSTALSNAAPLDSPDTVYIEEATLTPEVRKELEADGYKFTENRSWGTDEGIIISSKNGKRVLYGANDDRSPAGAAIGN